MGSADELRAQVYSAYKVGLIEQEQMEELFDELVEISKMLFGLDQSLET
jgi:four helix bundle protein